MAADKTTTDTVATSETSPANKEPVFSLEQLAKGCKELFGVSSSTFAGATCQLSTDKDKKFTVAEMKRIIEDWGNTPVFTKDRKSGKGGK